MADPDPSRLVEDWTGHLSLPTQSPAEDTNNCRHCLVKFSYGHKHACRLCGFMYCSRCTEKVHLPSKFQIKGKTGPCRACSRCVAICLDEKIKTVNDEDTRERVRLWGMNPSRLREIYPPEWVDIRLVPDCYKCHKLTKQKHICRACGKCYCNNCSMKHEFPDSFKKKPKPGPRRCCDKCRFLIIDGFKLVAVPSEKPQVPTRRPTMTKSLAEEEGQPNKSSKSTKGKKGDDSEKDDRKSESKSNLPFNQRCCVAGCAFPRASGGGLYCEGHVNGTIVEEPTEEEAKKKKPMGMMMGPAFGQPMPGIGSGPANLKKTPQSPTPSNASMRTVTVPAQKAKAMPPHDPSEPVVAEGSDEEDTKAGGDGSDGDSPLDEAQPRHATKPPPKAGAPTPTTTTGGEPAWKQKLNEQKAAKQAKEDEERRKKQFGSAASPKPASNDRWGDDEEPTKPTPSSASASTKFIPGPAAPAKKPEKKTESSNVSSVEGKKVVLKELPPLFVRPKKEKIDVLAAAGFDSKKIYVEVQWDDDGNMDDDEIPLVKGELIEVKDMSDAEGWWYGVKLSNRKIEGLFPYNLIKLLDLNSLRAELQAKQDALDETENAAYEAAEKAAIAAREAVQAENDAAEAAAKEEFLRAQEQAEKEAREKAAREAKEKADNEAKEKAEKEAAERAQAEKEAAEKAQAEKAAKDKAEADRLAKAEADRAAKEKADALAKEKAEALAKEKAAKEKAEAEKAAAAAAAKAKAEAERVAKEKAEAAKNAQEKAKAAEDAAKAKAAQAAAAKEQAEAERLAKEKQDQEAKETAEKDAAEKAAAAAAAAAATATPEATPAPKKKKKTLCPALYDHTGAEDDELSMKKGDIILVLKKDPDGWWMGRNETTGNVGLFPGNYVGPAAP